MVMVALAATVPAMVAIVRGRRIGRLRLSCIGSGLCSGLHGGCLLGREKQSWCCGQQKESQGTFHSISPKRMKSPVDILNHRCGRKSRGTCWKLFRIAADAVVRSSMG